jgi:hypothetical protein
MTKVYSGYGLTINRNEEKDAFVASFASPSGYPQAFEGAVQDDVVRALEGLGYKVRVTNTSYDDNIYLVFRNEDEDIVHSFTFSFGWMNKVTYERHDIKGCMLDDCVSPLSDGKFEVFIDREFYNNDVFEALRTGLDWYGFDLVNPANYWSFEFLSYGECARLVVNNRDLARIEAGIPVVLESYYEEYVREEYNNYVG